MVLKSLFKLGKKIILQLFFVFSHLSLHTPVFLLQHIADSTSVDLVLISDCNSYIIITVD